MPVTQGPAGVEQEMHKFKHGQLHSGKGGPIVRKRKQAIAIALNAAGMGRRRKDSHPRKAPGLRLRDVRHHMRSLSPAY